MNIMKPKGKTWDEVWKYFYKSGKSLSLMGLFPALVEITVVSKIGIKCTKTLLKYFYEMQVFFFCFSVLKYLWWSLNIDRALFLSQI